MFHCSGVESPSPRPVKKRSRLTPLLANVLLSTLPCLVHREPSAAAAAVAIVIAIAAVFIVFVAVVVGPDT